MYKKNITRSLFSTENIEYSLIFLILSIIFFYYFRGPLLDIYSKTEIAKEISSPIIVPSNVGEFLYWLIFVLTFTPYIVFIYKKKYEPFVLGFLIPSLIIYLYTYCTMKCFSLDPFYIEWLFLNLVPPFILIYLLRRSDTLKKDLTIIVSFVFLSKITHVFSMVYYYKIPYYPLVVIVSFLISSTFFASAYLILLLFAVEKIAKVKIFRQMKVLKEVNKNE